MKLVVTTVRKWTAESGPELQACSDSSDWSCSHQPGWLTDTLTSYISFLWGHVFIDWNFVLTTIICTSNPSLPSTVTPCLHWGAVKRMLVCVVFQRLKTRKAPRPDGISPSCLKACADLLTPVFTQLQWSVKYPGEIPSCFKCSTIVLVPKKSSLQYIHDPDICAHEILWKTDAEPPEGHRRTTGPPAVCSPSKFSSSLHLSVDDSLSWHHG